MRSPFPTSSTSCELRAKREEVAHETTVHVRMVHRVVVAGLFFRVHHFRFEGPGERLAWHGRILPASFPRSQVSSATLAPDATPGPAPPAHRDSPFLRASALDARPDPEGHGGAATDAKRAPPAATARRRRRCARRDPDNKSGLAEWMEQCLKGNAKYLAHDIPGAIDLYRTAIQLAPKRPLPHYLLGEAELGAGNLPEADTALSDAEQSSDDRDPNVRGKILFLLADVKEREKKWDDARAAWKAYGDYAAKHVDAGMTPATPPARIQAIDDMLKQDKAYDVVRQRIADEGKDSGLPIRRRNSRGLARQLREAPIAVWFRRYEAAFRNGSHSLKRHPLPSRIWALVDHFGRKGRRARRIFASSGVFHPLRRLQTRHAVTRFSHESSPPREPGQHVVDVQLAQARVLCRSTGRCARRGTSRLRRVSRTAHARSAIVAGAGGRSVERAARRSTIGTTSSSPPDRERAPGVHEVVLHLSLFVNRLRSAPIEEHEARASPSSLGWVRSAG